MSSAFHRIRARLGAGAAAGAAALALLPAVAGAEGGITQGQLIAQSCFACHGADGRGAETMPPIAGWSEEQLVEAMLDYREGERDPTVMDRHATGYTEAEIREVAAYIAEMD